MTTEEKLQHFYDVSIDSAQAEAAREIAEYKSKLDILLEEHKAAKDRQAEQELKTETDNAKREINKALSSEQLLIKRALSKKQNELREQLFTEIKNRLEEFMSTPAYTQYLCRKIQEAVAFAEEDVLTLHISPNDASLAASLTAQSGYPVTVSEENFFGGLKAVIPSKNILIDNSFSTLFDAEKGEFSFDGGMTHE